MKIAFFDTKPYDKPSFLKYGEKEGLEFKFFESRLSYDTAELASGCTVVCVFVNDTLDEATIDKLYALGVRVVALRCAGYNNVDLSAAFRKLHVVHVPAYSPNAVAEHTMALLLTSLRRIHKAYNRTRDFNFSLQGLTGFELNGKTVGVIGTGRIGRAFIDICRGFHMKVICYDKYPAADESLTYVPLPTLLQESDIISFHCPLTEETRHLISQDTLSLLKKGVVILNTSRGALIDLEALLQGIKQRIIGAACLDVYEEESDIFFEDVSGHILEDDTLARLISMPNVLLTSHQAFLTEEALDSIAKTTVENILSISSNGVLKNELCYRCGKQASCRKKKAEKCF